MDKIIKELKQIENIARFQQKRFIDKKAFNRSLILKEALDFICIHILNILKIEDEKNNY